MMVPLPKAVLSKLEAAEQKILKKLEENYIKTGNEMLKAQRAASVAIKARTKTAQTLINKAFKAEFLAFKAADELKKYKERMRKKYSN